MRNLVWACATLARAAQRTAAQVVSSVLWFMISSLVVLVIELLEVTRLNGSKNVCLSDAQNHQPIGFFPGIKGVRQGQGLQVELSNGVVVEWDISPR